MSYRLNCGGMTFDNYAECVPMSYCKAGGRIALVILGGIGVCVLIIVSVRCFKRFCRKNEEETANEEDGYQKA